MRNFFILFVALLVSTSMYGQDEFLTKASRTATLMGVRILYLDVMPDSVVSINPETYSLKIASLIDAPISHSASLLKKNKTKVVEYFKNLRLPDKAISSIIPPEGSDSSSFPFEIVTTSLGNTFIQYGVISRSNYNTLQLNTKERAKLVLEGVAAPFADNFKPLTSIPEINSYGIMVSYGAKDFSEKYSSPKAETVLLLIPKTVLIKYAKAEITDVQLLSQSKIYGINADTPKIKLLDIK